jgi:hypothetical protein
MNFKASAVGLSSAQSQSGQGNMLCPGSITRQHSFSHVSLQPDMKQFPCGSPSGNSGVVHNSTQDGLRSSPSPTYPSSPNAGHSPKRRVKANDNLKSLIIRSPSQVRRILIERHTGILKFITAASQGKNMKRPVRQRDERIQRVRATRMLCVASISSDARENKLGKRMHWMLFRGEGSPEGADPAIFGRTRYGDY